MKRLLLILFGAAVLLAQCTNESKSPPNMIFIIADDISWNDFGCYGNEDVYTPAINRLAREGLKFNNVYLTASSCSPSRTSIISGRYPHNTGSAELHTPLPEHLEIFPGQLQEAGYFTGASGKWHMGEAAKRGFDTLLISDVGPGGEDHWLDLLESVPEDQPFFLWLAALDAHRAWQPDTVDYPIEADSIAIPEGLADLPGTREDVAAYYKEIARFDRYVGQIHRQVIRMGLAPNTMIIVCADNGRPFPGAKTRVNDAGMKTPFILWWPQGIEDHGSEVDALVSMIDLAPTLVELAAGTPAKSYQGRSFTHLLDYADSSFRNVLFTEHNWHDYEAYERMVRTNEYMYIYNGRPQFPNQGPADAVSSPSMKDLRQLRDEGTATPEQMDVFMAPRPAEELYFLADDPFQRRNLVSDKDHEDALDTMRKLLAEWQLVTGDTEPEVLTGDWFLREAEAYIQTDNHSIRGEMPGAATGADTINASGPF